MRAQVAVGDCVLVGLPGSRGVELARVVAFRFADVRRRGRVVQRHRWAVLMLDSSTRGPRPAVPVEELRTLPRVRVRLRRRP